jgi:large subunit ribosomal protein L2
MAVKTFKPVTPGQRFKSVSSFEELTEPQEVRSLLAPL